MPDYRELTPEETANFLRAKAVEIRSSDSSTAEKYDEIAKLVERKHALTSNPENSINDDHT